MRDRLIVIDQLPVIREQLALIRSEVEEKVNYALSVPCTEETCKQVKTMRADLNKEFGDLEARRKEVKTKIMEPYEQFNQIYKECVSDIYTDADAALKSRIAVVEDSVKKEKAAKVKAYFEEYAESLKVDFVRMEDAALNITLSASLKSLKEQAKKFMDSVADDIQLINTQEHATEIFTEYKSDGACRLNAAKSITTVANRHAAIEAEAERRAESEKLRAAEAATEAVVAEVLRSETAHLTAPVQIKKPAPAETNREKLLCVQFSVYGTRTQLKALKQFLADGGYKYE